MRLTFCLVVSDFSSDFLLVVFIFLTLFLPGGSGVLDVFTFLLNLILLLLLPNNDGATDDDDDGGGVGGGGGGVEGDGDGADEGGEGGDDSDGDGSWWR